jgi:peptide/nickel transport system permease protein
MISDISTVDPTLVGHDRDACRTGTHAGAVAFHRRRVLFYAFTAWAAITINFFIPRMMRGDAVTAYMAQARGQLQPEAEKALRLMFGLDSSTTLWDQYVNYWGMLLRGDLGISISSGMAPVGDAIGSALPWTLGLVGTRPSSPSSWEPCSARSSDGDAEDGSTCSCRSRRSSDRAVLLAGPHLHRCLLDASRVVPRRARLRVGRGAGLERGVHRPGGLACRSSGVHDRHRLSGRLGARYAQHDADGARRGLHHRRPGEGPARPPRALAVRGTQRGAPQIQSFALALGFIVGGTLVMEMVFSYPGIGLLLLNATNAKDYALMQGIFLVLVLAVLIANILADIAYAILDPRVRETEA